MSFTIVSSRKIHNNTSWQIINEWEDDFVEVGKIPMEEIGSFEKTFAQKIFYHDKVFQFIPKLNTGAYKLFYTMVAPYEFNFFSLPACVPIIIDAWKPDLWRVEKFCRFNEFVFLGSLEAVQELKSRGVKNVFYSPVSISKKHQCLSYPEKDIDLLVYGRNHQIMWDWITKLFESKLHIVTCYPDKEKKFIAISNKKGVIGEVDKREDLMLLLKRSKYSTVSSTGNDRRNEANHSFTGGFSPVTPRFLECTVNYCQGVGIWYPNPDFNYFKTDDVALKTETFEQFEDAVNREPDKITIKATFDDFLEEHWSANRLKQILEAIDK